MTVETTQSTETAFPTLFSPIMLGRVEVRNRVVITSHGASEAFRRSEMDPRSYIEYLRRRAAGGAGLIVVQNAFLTGPVTSGYDDILDRHRRLAEAVHIEGAKLILQAVHIGAYGRSDNDVRRGPLVSFENVQTSSGETTHKLAHTEIEDIIDGYRRTAEMVVEAGMDGVELHGAHGYLIQQSLTPATNHRDDEWGRDRTLFTRRIIEAVRAELGPDRILGYRTPTDDLVSVEDGGIGPSGLARVIEKLLDTGALDVINTTIGDGGPSYARATPSYRFAEAPNIPALERLTSMVSMTIPVIGVGKVTSPAKAEELLSSGKCDLVAMTRAFIAEPDLMNKIRSGRANGARPCVGANVCVNRKLEGAWEITCFHNPEVLREQELEVRPTGNPRKILVIGAGPAGLKAAEVASRRGHQVVVADAGKRPGGRLRTTERTAAAGLFASVDHLISALKALEVPVLTDTTVDGQYLREFAPDSVILASGAQPVHDDVLTCAAPGLVVDSADALESDLGKHVLIYDAVGSSEAPLVAETLAERGHKIDFVTKFETVMPWAGVLHRVEILPVLRARCNEVISGGIIGDVDGQLVTVVRPNGDTILETAVDSLVRVGTLEPRLDLVRILDEAEIPFRIIGDALAPRTATEAFKEGHEVAVGDWLS